MPPPVVIPLVILCASRPAGCRVASQRPASRRIITSHSAPLVPLIRLAVALPLFVPLLPICGTSAIVLVDFFSNEKVVQSKNIIQREEVSTLHKIR
jgi:hypothetical protein